MSYPRKEERAEEVQYDKWERDLKNTIIKIHDPIKKQKVWNENFPVMTLSDEWLNQAEVF